MDFPLIHPPHKEVGVGQNLPAQCDAESQEDGTMQHFGWLILDRKASVIIECDCKGMTSGAMNYGYTTGSI
jgi:hypothetical protein